MLSGESVTMMGPSATAEIPARTAVRSCDAMYRLRSATTLIAWGNDPAAYSCPLDTAASDAAASGD